MNKEKLKYVVIFVTIRICIAISLMATGIFLYLNQYFFCIILGLVGILCMNEYDNTLIKVCNKFELK